MTSSTERKSGRGANGNWRILVVCVAFVAGMVGVSYAAVPLYRIFCQVTGYGGTTRRVEQASDRVLDRTVKVRFDANTAPGLDWEFRPEQREIELKIGETVQANFLARNRSDRPVTGQATYNVTPQSAGYFFNKVQCFCFTETTLAPGETLEMPVTFFVDPDMVEDPDAGNVTTITLSYTFFAREAEKPVAAVAEPVQEKDKL